MVFHAGLLHVMTEVGGFQVDEDRSFKISHKEQSRDGKRDSTSQKEELQNIIAMLFSMY